MNLSSVIYKHNGIKQVSDEVNTTDLNRVDASSMLRTLMNVDDLITAHIQKTTSELQNHDR